MKKFNQILREEVQRYIEEEYSVLKYPYESKIEYLFCIDFYQTTNPDKFGSGMIGYDVEVGFFTEDINSFNDYWSFEIQVLNRYIIEILIEELIEKYPQI